MDSRAHSMMNTDSGTGKAREMSSLSCHLSHYFVSFKLLPFFTLQYKSNKSIIIKLGAEHWSWHLTVSH